MLAKRATRGWRVGAEEGLLAADVATRLVSSGLEQAVRYRDVRLGISVLEVPADEAVSDRSFRFYLVEAAAWPELGLAASHLGPRGWKSPGVTRYRRSPDDPKVKLDQFEESIAVRSFLERVEREIDSVLRRAQERNGSWERK